MEQNRAAAALHFSHRTKKQYNFLDFPKERGTVIEKIGGLPCHYVHVCKKHLITGQLMMELRERHGQTGHVDRDIC